MNGWLIIAFFYSTGSVAVFLLLGSVHLKELSIGTKSGTSAADVAVWVALSLIWWLTIWVALIACIFCKK